MKKLVSLLIIMCLLFLMGACGNKPQNETPVQQTAENGEKTTEFVYNGLPDEIQHSLEDTLIAINNVHPGTAGSSLRAMTAAGQLLDLSKLASECDASEFEHACRIWYENNLADENLLAAYLDSYYAVGDRARAYADNPDELAGEAESCGYEFGEAYDLDQVLWVLNYMSIAMANAE